MWVLVVAETPNLQTRCEEGLPVGAPLEYDRTHFTSHPVGHRVGWPGGDGLDAQVPAHPSTFCPQSCGSCCCVGVTC